MINHIFFVIKRVYNFVAGIFRLVKSKVGRVILHLITRCLVPVSEVLGEVLLVFNGERAGY